MARRVDPNMEDLDLVEGGGAELEGEEFDLEDVTVLPNNAERDLGLTGIGPVEGPASTLAQSESALAFVAAKSAATTAPPDGREGTGYCFRIGSEPNLVCSPDGAVDDLITGGGGLSVHCFRAALTTLRIWLAIPFASMCLVLHSRSIMDRVGTRRTPIWPRVLVGMTQLIQSALEPLR